MDRVRKEDLAIYNDKSSNVVAIKGAFGRLYTLTLELAIGGVAVLLIAANNIANQYIDKGVCDNWSLLIFSIVLIVIAAAITIVRMIMLRQPNIYFIGNDMYIKEDKCYYLKVSANEIDEYGWMPFVLQNYAGLAAASMRYASCSHWGNLNIVINGKTYKLNCSSMKKAKHYIEGFMNGVSVEENNFDGDRLKALNIRMLVAASVVTAMMFAFCFLMFDSANNVISTISVILFAGSIFAGIILMIRFFVKYKDIRRMELQYYQDFVVNQPVKLKKSDESDYGENQDFGEYDNY
ncbi:MAG: hypothetical protein K2L70_02180 [Clostridia bacterium]|nr:hypothetical protein [Clostridia bacterium]